MESNENFVAQTENVEQTTEETVVQPTKTFTQEEMNTAVGRAKARERAKIEKQFGREYGELVEVLEAGTGKKFGSVAEMTGEFRKFYESNGVQFKQKPTYTDNDIAVLAKADAAEFINAGYEDVAEEVDRLADIGFENMTPREKALFLALGEYRTNTERGKELAAIGVTEDVYNSKEFTEFAAQFKDNIPITKVYEQYRKQTPQKDIKPMGSMKQIPTTTVKDYYSPEEIERLTEEDLADPKVWEAVRRSMTGS